MPLLRGNLHAHTTFSDGVRTPAELVEEYERRGYDFLAITHAVTVIGTLLWLPFGKFFHIFQRPAQLAIKFYTDVGKEGEQAVCARCRQPFATKIHVEDLIAVERELGYRYDWPDHPAGHYQNVCPACRRKMLALGQGHLWATAAPEGGSDGR